MLFQRTLDRNHTQEASQTVQPRVNIYETDKEVVLEAELAGVPKDKVSVEVEGDELRIHGRSNTSSPKDFTLVYAERQPVEYSRTFALSADIRRDRIDARYENGSLSVTLYKTEKPEPRKILIQ